MNTINIKHLHLLVFALALCSCSNNQEIKQSENQPHEVEKQIESASSESKIWEVKGISIYHDDRKFTDHKFIYENGEVVADSMTSYNGNDVYKSCARIKKSFNPENGLNEKVGVEDDNWYFSDSAGVPKRYLYSVQLDNDYISYKTVITITNDKISKYSCISDLGKEDISLVWENGNLTNIECDYVDEGEKGHRSSQYTYGNIPNKFNLNVLPFLTNDWIHRSFGGDYAFLQIQGYGQFRCKDLPTSINSSLENISRSIKYELDETGRVIVATTTMANSSNSRIEFLY